MNVNCRFPAILSVAVALSFSATASAGSDAALSQRVDAAVRTQMKVQKIPGVSIAVVRNGRVIKATGYGVANIEVSAPVRPDTIFEAGSITKQFTASAVMMLVEEGKVGLDDSITKYFPEAPQAWKSITVRHLLTHTSGIPDYWGDTEQNYYTKGVIDFRREYTDDELTRAYFAQSLDFQPGEKWSYCSTGYNLLGILIRRVTGKSYGDFLRERIFAPLHMDATRVFSWTEIVPHRASGYDLVDGVWKNAGSWMSSSVMTSADGGLLTNVLDLTKWDAALYSDKVLKRSTRDAMWTPLGLSTGSASAGGIGWFIADAHGHRVLYHTGGGYGFYADISRYVDDRLTIVVMTNVDETHTDVLKLVGEIAEIYLPATRGANPVKDW
jgi:CubicO group peptidase (beta-lactamase class C family)